MRVQSIDNQLLQHPGTAQYLIALFRLIHGLTAISPGLVLLHLAPSQPSILNDYTAILLFFGLLNVLIFQAAGIYSEALFSNQLRFRQLFLAWSSAFILLLFMHRELQQLNALSNKQLAYWYLGCLTLFFTERLTLLWALRRLMKRGVFLQRAVILGCTPSAIRLAEYLKNNSDFRSGVIGFIDDRSTRLPNELSGLPVLGSIKTLEEMIRQDSVQQVLVALPWAAESRISLIVDRLYHLPVNVHLVPDMLAFRRAHNRISEVAGLPMFNASELPLRGWSPFIKRSEDLLLSTLALILAAPLMLLLAVAIKLDSPGPVLFRQKRYGYNNRLIEVFKFRSMHQHLSDANAEQQTTRRDARITRVGQFIRKTSLDELPQLFNVLLGSMSMVGPRPHATATKAAGILFEEAVEEYSSRHRVKPGITGWAQVNGYRGETDTLEKIEKRVEYDLEYIETWSVWLDLYILFRTVPAVIFTKEAY